MFFEKAACCTTSAMSAAVPTSNFFIVIPLSRFNRYSSKLSYVRLTIESNKRIRGSSGLDLQRHENGVGVAVRAEVMPLAKALASEAERLVERDRGRVPREHV